ncbi:MAG: AMP-binding protein [Verrucomicrobia bacterium]|nr:AMP-binding protein [Verrucomicrobiota bacterium]
MSTRSLTRQWHTLDRETARERQGRKLHRYLRDCVLPFSGHYHRLFGELGLDAGDIRSVDDLKKIPFTAKEDLLPTPENPRRSLGFALIPDPHVLAHRPGVIARALLRGRARVQDELDREWRPTFMTATTGRSTESVAFLYTQHDLHNLAVGGGRVVEIARITREERMLNMFPFAPHLAFWYMHYAGGDRNTFALSTGGGKCMGTEGNLRAIAKLKPQVLAAMPTFIYHVLRQALDEKLRLEGVRLICLAGEKVPDGTRSKLAAMCAELGSPGVQVIATYGFTEAKLAWTECPVAPGEPPTGYHLYPDLGIIEVINPDTGQPVPDGQRGEIVWTPLDQRGTVVLRYRTGDLIENGLTWETCPRCGRTLPRLMGRISRVSDFRALRFQKIKGTIVDFNELEHALDDIRGLGAWQIELRKAHDDPLDLDEIVLHLVRIADMPEATLDRTLRELLHTRFELRPNRIVFHTADEIKVLHQVGVALKEQKVVDHRPKATAAPVEPRPPVPPARDAINQPQETHA